ncbi:MAG TPA: M48 family metallopeptidase [Anaerolineales bacterium]|nr:M48 family metallopeptidase [Anaerolineales bacterium]
MTAVNEERQQQARVYARLSRRLWLISLLLSAGYTGIWLLFGWGTSLRTWLVDLWGPFGNPWLLVPAVFVVFGGILMLVDLPLSFLAGFILPHRFGQSTQTLRGWLGDQAKALLVGAPLALLLLELLYFALRAAGSLWWLWAAGGLLIFNVLLVNLAPVLVMPLFNRYIPLGLEHQDLEQRLLRLAAKARTRVQGVYKFDLSRRTKAANAALAGMGRTRRIILGDTLISEFTADEIETVLAHELGHHVHRDILVLVLFGTLTTLGGLYLASEVLKQAVVAFGFAGVSDPAAMPALALVLGAYAVVTMPLENAVSRWRERMADRYALQVTGRNEAFASALVRLANQNLSEVEPEKWVVWMLHSHPPLGERIAAATEWTGTRGAQ